MRKIFVFIGLVLTSSTIFGQGEIQFIEGNHDFGEVPQTEGKISNDFQFINIGDAPVKVKYVKASCGCTTPHWTKDLVMPGDTGVIVAQYNPFNRPGSFNKRLTINTDAKNARVYVYIKGKVLPKPRSVETDYPKVYGSLRLKNKTLNIGKITTEKPVEYTFELYNDGDSVISIDSVQSIFPEHIVANYSSLSMAPKGKAEVTLTYDPAKRDNLGFNSEGIEIATDDKKEPKKSLTVMTTIQEYFPPMTPEELAEAPKLNLSDRIFDHGKIKEGESFTKEFELINAGLSKLQIRKIEANCGCIEIKKYKSKIGSGKSIKLEVTFDTKGARGRQYKTVSIFTNDPSAPTQTIAIRAEVTK